MITLERVSREFRVGDETVRAVREVSLDVAEAELTAVVGPSGGGKTTLLNLIGQLIRPTSGTIAVDGTILTGMGPRAAARCRNEMFGYLVQDFALVPCLLDNLTLSGPGCGASRRPPHYRYGPVAPRSSSLRCIHPRTGKRQPI